MQNQYLREPLMLLKPKFLTIPAFIVRIPLTIFLTVWGTGFFGGFMFLGITGLKELNFNMDFIPPWLVFAIPGIIFFVSVQFLSIFVEQKKYDNTEYIFYPDELVISENFWGKREKSLRYKNILEVSLKKGPFQQMYNIGSVVVYNASNTESNTGLEIKNVENPESVYNKIKSLINEAKSKE